MLQSLLVYSLLIFLMLYFSYLAREKEQWKYMVYAIVAYSIIFGMRYGVGVDYFNYKYNYESYFAGNGRFTNVMEFEWGFATLTDLCAFFNCHYSVYFGIIAFMQLYLTFLSCKHDPKVFPYIVFTFMVNCCWLTYSNGLRQIMGVTLWLLAIRMALERRVCEYYLLIFIAFLFHKSSLLLVIFYPIINLRKEWFKNLWVQYGLLIFGLFMSQVSFVQNLFIRFDYLLEMTGYAKYLTQGSEAFVENEVSIGLGFMITLTINAITIYYSNETKAYFKSDFVKQIYNFFFFAIVFRYIFISSQLLNRINYFFINTAFIAYAYTLMYLHREHRWMFWVMVGLISLIFSAYIVKGLEYTSQYVFFWQDELHHIVEQR